MSNQAPEEKAVGDSVPKIDNAVAVGENLRFQQGWWKFERALWIFFGILIVCDIAGIFGQGPAAKAKAVSSDGAMTLEYERIERTTTPSTMSFRFSPAAIEDGAIKVYVSGSAVAELGAQRIATQPASSVLGHDGVTYTFPMTDSKGQVHISLEPSKPGIFQLSVGLAGRDPIHARIIVVP